MKFDGNTPISSKLNHNLLNNPEINSYNNQ